MAHDTTTTESLLTTLKAVIPEPLLDLIRPVYHYLISLLGAIVYGFPSHSMKVIAVTGTKGKSTVTAMLVKVLRDAGESVAAVGSLGWQINDRTWPNTLKMTMPGRLRLHAFMAQAREAGVRYFILETTSEGIAQHRLVGIDVDCAVITNLRPEHLESHGSFEAYKQAKQKLFQKTGNIHVLNSDDPFFWDFASYPARKTLTYGLKTGMVSRTSQPLQLKLIGDFNTANALAALAVAQAYGLDIEKARRSLESLDAIPGRVEVLKNSRGVSAIVDYAHTPDSLQAVYGSIKPLTQRAQGKMICVFGAAGGGRDTWKRPIFGQIASQYCDQIILTDEDPYEEDPRQIIGEVKKGIAARVPTEIILDRKAAIQKAIQQAGEGDYVVITGKGSEISMAIAGGKKIPWSDKAIVEEALGS